MEMPTPLFVIALLVVFALGVGVSFILVRKPKIQPSDSFESSLDQEYGRLEALVASLPDYIMAVDMKGRVTVANQPVLELFSDNEVIGIAFDDVWQLKDASDAAAPLFGDKIMAVRPVVRQDLVYVTPNGPMNLAVRISPYPVGAKHPHGAVVIMRDITKQKTLDDQQQEFVSVASHELRTPLAIAEGTIELLQAHDGIKSNKQAASLAAQAYRTIRHLSLIVDDLTTLHRADQGLLDVDVQPVDAKEVFAQLEQDHKKAAEAKGLTMVVEVHPDAHAVLTSQFRVIEILRNFTTNAIKYTDTGTITLFAEPADGGGIRFSVRDTGVGVSTSDQKKLFGRFYRAEDYRTRTTEGTGLGLYIAKQLAERLNATVGFSSELGVGSTFYLTVPPYTRLQQDAKKVVAAAVQDLAQEL